MANLEPGDRRRLQRAHAPEVRVRPAGHRRRPADPADGADRVSTARTSARSCSRRHRHRQGGRSYTARNTAAGHHQRRRPDHAVPRVSQQVKNTVDAALANAKVVVTQPVGKISGDITTAFTGGAYADGKYAGGSATSGASESTLGDLVADALRDGIPAAQGKADLGIVNPGGLRDELLYAGSTATNPANTDGVVTYAEANAVLPFVNNIWLVQLTGRPAQERAGAAVAARPGRDRPYLRWACPTTSASPRSRQPVGKPDHLVLVDGVPTRTTPRPTRSARSLPRHRAATTSPRSRTARPRTPAWSTVTCGSAT